MDKCSNCNSSGLSWVTVPEFTDDLLGIPFEVVMVNGVRQQICKSCGHIAKHTIPNLQGLYAAVAIKRTVIPIKLNGAEIKFLRRCSGWKSKDLAKKLSITAEHLSRCERGHIAMSETHEKLLRACVALEMLDRIHELPIEIEEIRNLTNSKISAVRNPDQPISIRLELCKHESDDDCDEPKWANGPFNRQAA